MAKKKQLILEKANVEFTEELVDLNRLLRTRLEKEMANRTNWIENLRCRDCKGKFLVKTMPGIAKCLVCGKRPEDPSK